MKVEGVMDSVSLISTLNNFHRKLPIILIKVPVSNLGQPVSVVSFTCVQDALNYMHLGFSLTTDDYHLRFVNWEAENSVLPITNQISFGPTMQPQLPMVIIVDEANRFHPDFDHHLTAFQHLKLMVLTEDQSLAIREMDLLNPPQFEVDHVPRPFSSMRWRTGSVQPAADHVCALLKNVLEEFTLDITDTVRRGAVDVPVV